MPGITAELGFTKAEMGTVLMALKLAYGVGQFINGQLAGALSAAPVAGVGLLVSAGLNILFGWATALYFLISSGPATAMCRPSVGRPVFRVLANWFPVSRRGRAMGIIGTGYQLGGA